MPTKSDPSRPKKRQSTKGAEVRPPRSGGARKIEAPKLHLIPVDAHRVFAHWYVPADVVSKAARSVAGPPSKARLALRILDVQTDEEGRQKTALREEIPASGAWHEGFIHLESPGGSILASLGVKDAKGRFSPIVTSPPVTLPDAPVSNRLKTIERPREKLEPAAPAVRLMPADRLAGTPPAPVRFGPGVSLPAGGKSVLDEWAIVSAAMGPEDLPHELRQIPVSGDKAASDPAIEEPAAAPRLDPAASDLPAVPETPTIDERMTVIGALKSAVEQTGLEHSAAGAEQPSRPESPGSDRRLASHFDPTQSEAPVRLKATLVVSGRLESGHQLRIGDQEIVPNPNGWFVWQQPLAGFALAWEFLLHAVAGFKSSEHPSLELLARIPDTRAPLTLQASIEIEGEVEDAGYLSRLPPNVRVDGAGRFRLARPLPAGAWFLPQIALFAGAPADE